MDYAFRRLFWDVPIANMLDDSNCDQPSTSGDLVAFIEPDGMAHNNRPIWICDRNGVCGTSQLGGPPIV